MSGKQNRKARPLRACEHCGVSPIRTRYCDPCSGRKVSRNGTDVRIHVDKYA